MIGKINKCENLECNKKEKYIQFLEKYIRIWLTPNYGERAIMCSRNIFVHFTKINPKWFSLNAYIFKKNGPIPASFWCIFVLFKHKSCRKKL